MVAVIKTGHSIYRIFNYNENKIKESVAECIGAGNYPVDVDKMSVNIKLNRLLKQAELNKNVRRNSVHISLNFDPSEIFSKEKLMEIAETYMEKIGFGNQPYLVYWHHDAGHPHIHLLSIKVRADGSRIDTQNIGRNQSEIARKEIEKSFGLVRAADRKRKQKIDLKPLPAQRVHYGRSETKRAIQNVLDQVIGQYKYASLPELNAVLKQYNVTAERGSEKSRVYQNHGLLYRILDDKGKSIGIPIKASAFHSRPTLKFLEERFSSNEAKKIPHKARVKITIDLVLWGKKDLSIQRLVTELEKKGIATVLRENSDGLIYGITYVDYQTKCVFNGSALGKAYSAKAIQERCNLGEPAEQKALVRQMEKLTLPEQILNRDPVINPLKIQENQEISAHTTPAPELGKLMQPEQIPDYLPYQLKRKRKKKKLSNNL